VKNRTLGSIFIVAGNTIGAGMLAMPLAEAGVGFGVTLALLIMLLLLMCYTALLLVEVYQHAPVDKGLGALAKHYLGTYWQWFTGFSMLFLMYSITAAYISGRVNYWRRASVNGHSNPFLPLMLAYSFVVAGEVVCVSTHSVDFFNRILFGIKIIFLIIILVLIMPYVEKNNLMTMPLEQGLAVSAIPIIFALFGFHSSVPSIVSYMGGNVRALRWVFIIGSAIPLVIYIFWQLAILGALPSQTFIGILAQQA